MSRSIYDIQGWGSRLSYKKNDIVSFPKNTYSYYYALKDHDKYTFDFNTVGSSGTSGSSGSSGESGGVTVTYDAAKWTNAKTTINDVEVYEFIWNPSYASSLKQSPKVKSVSLSEGFEHVTQDQLNSIPLMYNLNFENRDLDETAAILHFLHKRGGKTEFAWTPPKPFEKKTLFICENWKTTSKFDNIFNITCSFEQYYPTKYTLTQTS